MTNTAQPAADRPFPPPPASNPATSRPALPFALVDAAMEKDLRVQQALGLVEDAARVAATIVYGHYATGPEERTFRKSVERAAMEYFRAKSSAGAASNYIKPSATAESLGDAVKAMTIAVDSAVAEASAK